MRWACSGKTSDPVGPPRRTSRSLGQSDRAPAPVTSGHSGALQWWSQDGGDQLGQERLARLTTEVCRARVARGRSLSSAATASSPRTVDAVRVLVASARPRACGVTEVDEHAGDARQIAMATHLDTLESQVGDHRRCAGQIARCHDHRRRDLLGVTAVEKMDELEEDPLAVAERGGRRAVLSTIKGPPPTQPATRRSPISTGRSAIIVIGSTKRVKRRSRRCCGCRRERPEHSTRAGLGSRSPRDGKWTAW